jgi:ubiquinone biosynthesis protein
VISGLVHTGARQKDIAEVVLRNGWDYMRRLLMGRQSDELEFPPPAVLRKILIELGPVYVKLGQLLSTRPDLLPADYIDSLSTLQSNVPAVPWSSVEPVLQQALKRPIPEIFSEVQSTAIAAGSIAQIHRARLLDGREVALKIQRPGIAAIVEQDIKLIRFLADLASQTKLGKEYELKLLAEEFVTALQDELNFRREATYTDELRRNLAKSRWIDPEYMVIPAIVWELTSESLLVMEWITGTLLLDAHLDGKGYDSRDLERREITRRLFRAFAQQVYVDGLFHADPHPGNLFYIGGGHVALLDCGMVGRLDPNTQRILTELLLAIVEIDSKRCAQLTLELAETTAPVTLISLEQDYERLLRKYYNRNLEAINFSQVFYEILQVARNNKIRLPSSLGLYAKTIANLEGVTRKFDPEVNLFEEIKPLMTDLFRKQLIGESPLQAILRTAMDLKSLSLQSPRQLELLLDRITSENLTWKVSNPELPALRKTLELSANRLSFSIVVGALIMGGAMVVSRTQSNQFLWVGDALFIAASVVGLWLLLSILRSGQLR